MFKVTLMNIPADDNYVTVTDDTGRHLGGRASWGPHKSAELQEALISNYGLDETSVMALLLEFGRSGNTSAELEIPRINGKTHFD